MSRIRFSQLIRKQCKHNPTGITAKVLADAEVKGTPVYAACSICGVMLTLMPRKKEDKQ